MFQFQRKNKRNGQRPIYTYQELNDRTLRVIRDNEGEIFQYDFSIGHKFVTYSGLPVEMVSLNPNGGSTDFGYYLIVREILKNGLGKFTDVSSQNQIDIIYWNLKSTDDSKLSAEVLADQEYVEGSVKQVTVNKYERDPKARDACIRHYGSSCRVCSFNFSDMYGPYGEGFIEVHHIKPLNEIRQSYVVDPVKDLIPVCSNCHSILHRGKNPISIEGLKSILPATH